MAILPSSVYVLAMHDADFLFIVAELAIALAGFSGLVTVIAHRQDRSPGEVALGFQQLRAVLVISLPAAAFALLPSLLERMGAAPDIAWRVSAALFLVVSVGVMGTAVPSVFRAYAGAGRRVPLTVWLSTVLIAVMWLILLLCALGCVPTSAYLAALFITLYLAGVAFVRVFAALAKPGSPA